MRRTLIRIFLIVSVTIISSSSFVFARETWQERRDARREKVREWLGKGKTAEGEKKDKFGQGDQIYQIKHDGLIRQYKVHVPKNYKSDVKTPVVIYVHGGGGDLRSAYMDGIDKMSDKYGFLLVVPEGTGEMKAGHLRGYWNGGKWAGGECCGDTDDVGFISKMIDEIKANFNMDGSRIYATGISNGGLMTNRLGCELADKIAAIATVAPAALMQGCSPSGKISVMDIHGTADPANPIDGSEPKSIFGKDSGSGFSMLYKRMTPFQVMDEWKRINGCSDQTIDGYKKGSASCTVYNQCARGVELELCVVEGMGHTFPGGAQYLPLKIVGRVSRDISFDQIWEFFKRYSLEQN